METQSVKKGILRFIHCNSYFYPYIEKVLMGLSEEITFKEFLDNTHFEIVSFRSETVGNHFLFGNLVKNLIILNESLLEQPEPIIEHVIAHEIQLSMK